MDYRPEWKNTMPRQLENEFAPAEIQHQDKNAVHPVDTVYCLAAVFGLFDIQQYDDYRQFHVAEVHCAKDYAVDNSIHALRRQAEAGLLRTARDQASLSNSYLEKVEAETKIIATYAEAIWKNPKPFRVQRHSFSMREEPADIQKISVHYTIPLFKAPDEQQKTGYSVVPISRRAVFRRSSGQSEPGIGVYSSGIRRWPCASVGVGCACGLRSPQTSLVQTCRIHRTTGVDSAVPGCNYRSPYGHMFAADL